MSTAQLLTHRRNCRTLDRNAVLTVVMDEHDAIAMTEPLLDTWWTSLDPELKAEIYEAALDSDIEVAAQTDCPCIFCGPNSPLTPNRLRKVEIFADEMQAMLQGHADFLKRPVQ